MIRAPILLALGAFLLVAAGPVRPVPIPVREWALLGQVTLDAQGCSACPASFPTPDRYLGFALASDSPFATDLSGRIDVTCTDGSTYDVFLVSARRPGVFQLVPNACVNFDSAKITLNVTTVGLSPPDKGRGVTLEMYGIR